MDTQPFVRRNFGSADNAMVLQQILETLGRLELHQEEILRRIPAVESALAEMICGKTKTK